MGWYTRFEGKKIRPSFVLFDQLSLHDNDPFTSNKEFAPDGWHIPESYEWTTLEEYLIANHYNYDGTTTGNKIAKAMASKTGWNLDGIEGNVGNDEYLNNSSGFSAYPEVAYALG